MSQARVLVDGVLRYSRFKKVAIINIKLKIKFKKIKAFENFGINYLGSHYFGFFDFCAWLQFVKLTFFNFYDANRLTF